MALKNLFRALGKDDLPPEIELDGRLFRRQTTFKHSAIAAVGLYRDKDELVVLKCYRRAPALGVPLAWAGGLMARYEAAVIQSVQDIRGVPKLRGRCGRTGILREYVPGDPLTRDARVDRRFFREMFVLLRRLHRRGIAYVNLEKAENILLGEDGLPYLIDFQVAFYVPDRFLGRTFLIRWLRRQLQRADLYHARKHFRRVMRERLTPRQIAHLRRRPWFVKLGNVLHAPYKRLRRWLLGKS